ncbi:MAG: hydrogen gas-evolving membrane-bound hydrogenase subunit E [Planctomycetota bacterium]
MASSWLLLFAILAPAVTGLATLLLPRRAITARVLLAVTGPAVAFVLVCSHLGSHGVAGGVDHHAAPAGEHHNDSAHVDSGHSEHGEHHDKASADKHAGDEHHAEHSAVAGIPAPPGTAPLAWVPSMQLNLAFLADGLGGFFALLVSGIGVLIVLYARGYFGSTEQAQRDLFRFYPTLGFFATAMMGVVLADYTLLTLVFWELTSISSFLLIGWDRYDKHAVKLAKQAFFTTGLGGMGLLGGIALFGSTTGIWRWSEMLAPGSLAAIDFASPAILWSFVLMFIGAASKSAQWPLHYWLPGAMAAPTPVSAYLHSATMVKAGVFLVGRLFPVFGLGAGVAGGTGLEIWPGVVTWFGAVTMLYGGVTAVNQHDLKRIFAYTTVSQLGLLMAMYGLGGFGYESHGHAVAGAIDFDITQIANHAFYKAPLFICAGAIGHVASRSLPELFGAFHQHKAICLTMLLAGYALAAGPGTISFAAKELFLYGIYHAADGRPWLWIIMLMTIATAACNVAIFVRLLTTLMGWRFGMGAGAKPQAAEGHGHDDDHHHEHEYGFGGALIWLPAVPLVAMQYLGGLITPLWNVVFLPFEKYALYDGFHGVPSLLHALLHPGIPLLCSIVAIGLGVLLGVSKLLRGQHTDVNDKIYPAVESGAMGLGRSVYGVLQTGSLRWYTVIALAALMACFFAAVRSDPGMWEAVGPAAAVAFEAPLGVILGFIICLSAVLIPMTRSRVVRVLLLGACGFTVVAMYIIYQAPDLVLTQLMVEIISVLLFVLVLRLLPSDPPASKRPRVGWHWRIVLAAGVGLMFGWMTLVAADAEPAARLGEWFTQMTYYGPKQPDGSYGRGGGGFNIVNVILVDFRGFDTFGEVCVLALAALGVWSMLPGRRKELEEPS